MDTTLTLELKFRAADGKNKNLIIRNPTEGLTSAEIKPVMQTIIGLDAFAVKGTNPYSLIDSARYVKRTITDLFDSEM